MLCCLRIKNFAIIDDLSINFEAGLNVLTGETGAGKSIIVDAIGLILGDKASADMIKTGSKEASIEACFDNKKHPLLEELNIDSDNGIIIRRSISSQGKGRAYINDTAVSLQTLAAVGEDLINIHGQHEHQGLLKRDAHLLFLDSFGGILECVEALKALFDEVVGMRDKVAEFKRRVSERNQRIEFLKFQIKEIESASLRHREKETIQEEMRMLLNLSRLRELSESAYGLLYESDGSCIEKMSIASSYIKDMANFDIDAGELVEIMESILPQIDEAALLLRRLKAKYDVDPQRLSELDERLDIIKRLEKKYGGDISSILKHKEIAEEELNELQHAEEKQEMLEAELALKEKELLSMAEDISEKRRFACSKMEKMVESELGELGFQKALFKVDLKKKESVSAMGIDDVEFLFSANLGEPAKPLIKIASGGELSRIMLALKCIEIQRTEDRTQKTDKKESLISNFCALGSDKTLIFDEVDAGIGGITAHHVSKRLRAISKNYQVLCITHLPQMAAISDHHILVEKKIEGDKAKISVKVLTDNERHNEIARMLSGKITDVSLKHAKELIGTDF